MGIFLGWPGVVEIILIRCFSGSAVGLGLILGPFHTFGAVVALSSGEVLIGWYFGFLR